MPAENYGDVITLINRALRDEEAWPDSGTATQDQIDLLYVATLAVGSQIEISRFSGVATEISGTQGQGRSFSYPLPADLFKLRDDQGIINFDFDGKTKFPQEAVGYKELIYCAQSDLYRDAMLFHLDVRGNRLFTLGVETAKINYVGTPTRPETGNYGSTDYPLNDVDGQRAVHLVAYHVSGITIRDSAAAQFHALLENEYNINRQPAGE